MVNTMHYQQLSISGSRNPKVTVLSVYSEMEYVLWIYMGQSKDSKFGAEKFGACFIANMR